MPNRSTRVSSAASFPTAAASAARGDLVEVIEGPTPVTVHALGADVTYDLEVSAEAPMELHSHGATLVVIPIHVAAEQTAAHVPEFEGSLELTNTGGRGFDVVLEGDFEDRRHHLGERAAFAVRIDDLLAALLRALTDRIERHVRSVEATTGIPM